MKLRNQWLNRNLSYLLWSILLLVFCGVMADQYCKMTYGGALFYILSGQNEITPAEKKYLENRDYLVYGETLDSFPAQLNDPILRKETGFNTDLMDQLALEMETTVAFQPLLWSDVFNALDTGVVDIIQISYSEERDKNYFLTAPIYKSKGVVFMQNTGTPLKKLEELKWRTLAGIKGDYGLSVLKEKVPELQILEYDSIGQCAQMLKEQKVDGIVADEQNIMYYAQGEKMFQNYYIMEEEIYYEDVVFAVRGEEKELGEILNKAIYHLRTKDTLNKLQKKWFLSSVLGDALPPQRMNAWTIQLSLGLFTFFVYLFWHIHDKTKALVVERTKELDQERRRLETIIASIPQYLFEVDANGTIQMMNQQPPTDLPLFNSDRSLIIEESLLKMLQEVQKIDYTQKEINLGKRWFRITCSRIHGERSSQNAIMLVEDITLYRLQEWEDMQNYKMAAIGQLASGVSHELKNPLEIICNYCYAIKKGILHTEEEMLHTVDIIESEAKGANRIVESLLSFARATPKEISETEAKPCLQQLLELQKPLFKKKNIHATLICDDHIFIQCNPEGIKRIIINLITNGADAMEDSGGNIKITVVQEADRVKIEFQDDGKGMNKEQLEQIFNPFYTTKSAGTGLGLYLVYHQLEENKGTIQVTSQEGVGTTFTVYFPI